MKITYHHFIQIVCVHSVFILMAFVHAVDNPHFYRAAYLWPEPRLENAWLTSWDISFGGGTTGTSRNRKGHITTLLNLYGPNNIQQLAVNVPGLNPADPLDAILINLAILPTNDSFGQLKFSGKFHILESMINMYQNLVHGFFLSAHMPIRLLRINQISFADLSPDTGFPNKSNSTWQAFLANFDAIMARHNLSLKDNQHVGVGDLSILAGWTLNYQETKELDYIDVTGQWGVLFPTGKKKNPRKPFDLPLGYDGYFGIPALFDASMGAFEWFTMGIHIGALFLLNKKRALPIQTAAAQNGQIKLTVARVCVDPGTIWQASTYVKVDHVARGVSLLFGYSFHAQDRTIIEGIPFDTIALNDVNKDRQLGSWSMHTLHFLFEYDFSYTRCDRYPRLGIWFNCIVAGQRIFNTHIFAPYIGMDIAWHF